MKSALCLIVVSVALCIPEMTHSYFIRKSRAFKTYKRTGSEDGASAALSKLRLSEGGDIAVKEMADVLAGSPDLLLDFVMTYVDRDGDGLISAKELITLTSQRRR